MSLADRLADKGKEYELNALAAEERGDLVTATCFSTIAIAFHEFANVLFSEALEERDVA
jgi:hypothetical protein